MTGAIIALDAATGEEVWQFIAEADGACTAVTIADGNAFVGCLHGYSYALDAATGAQIWSAYSATADPSQRGAGQEYADGVIYQPDDVRTVLALDAATGTELWRYEVDGFLGEMAISGGSIFFGTGSGSLYALGGTENPGAHVVAAATAATPASTPMPVASPSSATDNSPVQFVRTIEGPDGGLIEPGGAVFDPDGNLLVIEMGKNRIVKLAPDGTAATFIGDASGPGALVMPNSVTFDGDGNMYVGDSGRDAVVKFDPDGNFLLAWGSTGAGDGQFDEPSVGGIDPRGRLWVNDWGNHRLQLFDQQGQHLLTVAEFGAGPGQLNHANSMTLDNDGNAYVAECDNRRVSKFGPDGAFLGTWEHDFLCLAGIDIDREHGIVYVSDADNMRIQVFDTDGNFLAMWGEAGEGEGQFTAPTGVTLDGRGHVYVTDIASGKISEFALQPPLWPEGTPVA